MTNENRTRRQFLGSLGLGAAALNSAWPLAAAQPTASAAATFVRVSPCDPRYFELDDGRPYIPVGFNLVLPAPEDFDSVVAIMAEHGVNYCRIWLDQPPWNVIDACMANEPGRPTGGRE